MDDNLKRFLFASRVLAIGSLAALAGSAVSTWVGSTIALDAEIAQVRPSGGEDREDPTGEAPPPGAVAKERPGQAVSKTDVAAEIVSRNPFCPTCKPVEPTASPEEGGPTRPGEIPTTLPLALLGTMEADDPRYSMATIQDTEEGKLGAFGIEDSIRAGVTLKRVERGRVVFLNGRQMEYLDATKDLPKPKIAPKKTEKSPPRKNSRAIEGAETAVNCDGDTCTVDRAFVDKILSNPSLLAKQARVVPSRRGNEVKGFKFYGIRPGSLPKLFGMSNGDMVTSINGSPLTSIDEAMGLYTKLRRASNLTVVIDRKGKSITKDISIR
ncbi:MAG: type II secretion system protein GspC [Nannocystaceae bacterium]